MIKKKHTRILTAGTFDLLHSGHINLLKEAKKLGLWLIVALSTDGLIKTHKGYYPILSYKQRKEVLEAITYVDEVIEQTTLIDIKQFYNLDIDLFVIGDDWKNRKDVESLTLLKKFNLVVFIPYTKELSTTKIKNKIIKEWKLE